MKLVIERESGLAESIRSSFNDCDFLDPEYDEFIVGVTKGKIVYHLDSMIFYHLRKDKPANINFEEYRKMKDFVEEYLKIRDRIINNVLYNTIDILLLDDL